MVLQLSSKREKFGQLIWDKEKECVTFVFVVVCLTTEETVYIADDIGARGLGGTNQRNCYGVISLL